MSVGRVSGGYWTLFWTWVGDNKLQKWVSQLQKIGFVDALFITVNFSSLHSLHIEDLQKQAQSLMGYELLWFSVLLRVRRRKLFFFSSCSIIFFRIQVLSHARLASPQLSLGFSDFCLRSRLNLNISLLPGASWRGWIVLIIFASPVVITLAQLSLLMFTLLYDLDTRADSVHIWQMLHEKTSDSIKIGSVQIPAHGSKGEIIPINVQPDQMRRIHGKLII